VVNLDQAYAACQRLVASHYENFPVASHVLPRRMRPHIAAIYAFARTADDFADEGDVPPHQRLSRLDDWLLRLRACLAPGQLAAASDDDAVFLALSNTIRECALPVGLFEDLLSAFRQDVTTNRYESWPDLLDYCRRSANPVGRLVLRVAGHRSDALDAASDAVCTALQLTNFLQDLERDWQKGRLYLPASDLRACGAQIDALDGGRLTSQWRDALLLMAGRTRILFDQGRPVCDGVAGRLRFELRVTWLGGRRILDALERDGFDVFARRPALGVGDIPALLRDALRWRAPDAVD